MGYYFQDEYEPIADFKEIRFQKMLQNTSYSIPLAKEQIRNEIAKELESMLKYDIKEAEIGEGKEKEKVLLLIATLQIGKIY